MGQQRTIISRPPPSQPIDYEKLAEEARKQAAQPVKIDYEKLAEGLRAGDRITQTDDPKGPSPIAGVDNATYRQWQAAGLNTSDLLPVGSLERKETQQGEGQRANELGKGALEILAMTAGGEAIGAGAAATRAPQLLQRLMRIGGNAGLGAGAAAATGHDPATGAILGGGSSAVGEGLQIITPPIAKTALRVVAPIARKFGRDTDLGLRAIETPGIRMETLAENAGADTRAARDAKGTLLRTVDTDPIPVRQIASRANARVRPDVGADFEAGLQNATATGEHGGPTISRFANRAGTQGVDFRTERGEMVHDWGTDPVTGRMTSTPVMQQVEVVPVLQPRQITASRLDRLKGRYDTAADALHRAAETGAMKNLPRAAEARALAQESGQAIERRLGAQGAQQYRGLNREIMDSTGLRLAAQGRADIPASGLQNLGLAFGGAPSATRAAMRAALTPEALMMTAKTGFRTGQALTNPALRATILRALLSGSEPER